MHEAILNFNSTRNRSSTKAFDSLDTGIVANADISAEEAEQLRGERDAIAEMCHSEWEADDAQCRESEGGAKKGVWNFLLEQCYDEAKRKFQSCMQPAYEIDRLLKGL